MIRPKTKALVVPMLGLLGAVKGVKPSAKTVGRRRRRPALLGLGAVGVALVVARTSSRSPHALLALRVLGAILILFVGADHFYEYSVDDYSVVPTIGALFLLNFISASVVGLLLLAPLKRILHRLGTPVLELATLSGLGIAATSLAALLISEQTPLFGFMESNYRPAILVALVSETAATLCLALLLVLIRRARSANRRSAGTRVAERSQASPSTT
ncbi:MAG TPA: hypothetical protein VGY30_06590 [Solirubrobacteraceae bacterium]|jgi:hypothetical protein|nr:hypothetical protein [Solirubrobacteraceae bacterium]